MDTPSWLGSSYNQLYDSVLINLDGTALAEDVRNQAPSPFLLALDTPSWLASSSIGEEESHNLLPSPIKSKNISDAIDHMGTNHCPSVRLLKSDKIYKSLKCLNAC